MAGEGGPRPPHGPADWGRDPQPTADPDLEDVETPLLLHHHAQCVRHVEQVRHLRKIQSQQGGQRLEVPAPSCQILSF